MLKKEVYTPHQKPNYETREEIIDFLFENLEEYGDPREDIDKCVQFALQEKEPSFGGFIVLYRKVVPEEPQDVLGVTIVNETGMMDYIPENILVYIATHKHNRGIGIGKKMMHDAIEMAEGNIALHVEPENPARKLYEKFGFNSKYVEMRYNKKK